MAGRTTLVLTHRPPPGWDPAAVVTMRAVGSSRPSGQRGGPALAIARMSSGEPRSGVTDSSHQVAPTAS